MVTTVMAMENAMIDKGRVSAFVMKVSFHLHASTQLKIVQKLTKILPSYRNLLRVRLLQQPKKKSKPEKL